MLRLLAGLAVAGPALGVAVEAVAFLAGTSTVPAVEGLVGSLCHHDPARTLTVAGRLLPVCARCTGLYLGAAAGGLLSLAVPLDPARVRTAARLGLGATALGLVAAVLEASGLLATANPTRVALGALLGVGLPLIVALGARLISAAAAAPRGR